MTITAYSVLKQRGKRRETLRVSLRVGKCSATSYPKPTYAYPLLLPLLGTAFFSSRATLWPFYPGDVTSTFAADCTHMYTRVPSPEALDAVYRRPCSCASIRHHAHSSFANSGKFTKFKCKIGRCSVASWKYERAGDIMEREWRRGKFEVDEERRIHGGTERGNLLVEGTNARRYTYRGGKRTLDTECERKWNIDR